MSRINIRPARPDERSELEAIQWRASLANEGDRPHLLANPDAIELPADQIERGLVMVAELEGKVVGFEAIIPEPDFVELDGLFVEPNFWRGGIGALLVDAAAQAAARMDLPLKVIANPHALGFYERVGFRNDGEVQTRFGPGLRMSLCRPAAPEAAASP